MLGAIIRQGGRAAAKSGIPAARGVVNRASKGARQNRTGIKRGLEIFGALNIVTLGALPLGIIAAVLDRADLFNPTGIITIKESETEYIFQVASTRDITNVKLLLRVKGAGGVKDVVYKVKDIKANSGVFVKATLHEGTELVDARTTYKDVQGGEPYKDKHSDDFDNLNPDNFRIGTSNK